MTDRVRAAWRSGLSRPGGGASAATASGGDDPWAARSLTIPPDLDPQVVDIIRAVGQYTLTSPERIAALCESVRYVVESGIPGAFVESGVWRGGSALAMLLTLGRLGVTDRDVWLYDTYTHMPAPGAEDVDIFGESAQAMHDRVAAGEPIDPMYSYLSYDQVQALLLDTGYPAQRLHLVAGLVEETIPANAPARIALLRLDTDYYSSTRHELTHLYPRVSAGGAVIIDDYGHWKGSRQATDEYLEDNDLTVLLHRIDYTARMFTAPPGPGR
jgi:hypothetical protein